MTAAQLVLDSVSKAYGDTHAVTNVTLQIDPGELDCPAWPLRLRQNHHIAHDRRLYRSHRG